MNLLHAGTCCSPNTQIPTKNSSPSEKNGNIGNSKTLQTFVTDAGEEEEVSTDLVSPDLVSVAGNEVRVSV